MSQNNDILIKKLKDLKNNVFSLNNDIEILSETSDLIKNHDRLAFAARFHRATTDYSSGTNYDFGTILTLDNVIITKVAIYAKESYKWTMYFDDVKIEFTNPNGGYFHSEYMPRNFTLINSPIKVSNFKINVSCTTYSSALISKLYVEYIPIGG